MSKRILPTIVFMGTVLIVATSANAASTLFQTGQVSLQHENYYAWNLNFDLSGKGKIVGAVLTYHNLYDSTYADADRLFTHLMDNHETSGSDQDAHDGFFTIFGEIPPVAANDAWAGNGHLLTPVYDPVEGVPQTVAYDLGALGLLNQLSAFCQNNSKFSIGIDPDCYFTASNITFEITTASVPGPGSILLGGAGTILVGWLRRRKTL